MWQQTFSPIILCKKPLHARKWNKTTTSDETNDGVRKDAEIDILSALKEQNRSLFIKKYWISLFFLCFSPEKVSLQIVIKLSGHRKKVVSLSTTCGFPRRRNFAKWSYRKLVKWLYANVYVKFTYFNHIFLLEPTYYNKRREFESKSCLALSNNILTISIMMCYTTGQWFSTMIFCLLRVSFGTCN
jgi:hypothetical protein